MPNKNIAQHHQVNNSLANQKTKFEISTRFYTTELCKISTKKLKTIGGPLNTKACKALSN